ncbi:MAG: FprA family A-type flavoprotein, partial [Thermoprotei archaeon]
MVAREIVKGVFSLSAIDWDRRYFDELIPLPEGTTYNAYLVKGERITVLIDTVDPTKKDELFRDLEELKVESIDYIVSNHAEQDHSGSIPDVLERYPEAKVMTNAKCKGMLIDHLHIPEERFRVVSDGEVVDLGGRRLKFLLTPWVHWPETMVTYLEEDGILFTCDFFGSHLATSNLYARGDYLALSGAKRYYAEIMMPFRNFIKKHIAKLENLEI